VKPRINIVTVKSGWILQKIAERIAKAGNTSGLGSFSISHRPQIGTDVNFYCDVQNCYSHATSAMDIGLFTHVHADDMSTVNKIAFDLDYIFHMASRYKDMFATTGYDKSKMSTMVPWEIPDDFVQRKQTIGIFQRGRYEGKGFHRMLEIIKSDSAKRFNWVFVGNDWEGVVDAGTQAGVYCRQMNDTIVSYPGGYSDMYDAVDFVLIPSKWEGGPICALEALAKGKQIISADVGWVKELAPSAIVFRDDAGLISALNGVSNGVIRRRKSVEQFSYETCARQIIEAFNKLEFE
jgi:glycosyltransferase involved in cell wall biosynthesis